MLWAHGARRTIFFLHLVKNDQAFSNIEIFLEPQLVNFTNMSGGYYSKNVNCPNRFKSTGMLRSTIIRTCAQLGSRKSKLLHNQSLIYRASILIYCKQKLLLYYYYDVILLISLKKTVFVELFFLQRNCFGIYVKIDKLQPEMIIKK